MDAYDTYPAIDEHPENILPAYPPYDDSLEVILPTSPLYDGYAAAAYFPRIDFEAIDFTAMILPTCTPHGQIGHWYVRYISSYLPGRVSFTYRELDTALWLEQMLYAKGFNEYQVRIQTFSYADVSGLEDYFDWGLTGLNGAKEQGWHQGHISRNYSQNVIVTIPGQSPQTIIIGAHYDSLRYPGASDNASGTALLMENAQRMLAADNYYTLKYVFFGAHEIGLLGAFYFYESLTQRERENILFMISADVLIEGPDLLFTAGYAQSRNNIRHISSNDLSVQLSTVAADFYHSHGIVFHPIPATGSDELVFLYKGYTVLAFWGAEISPRFNTNFLHSYEDCYEYISARFPGMVETAMNAFALLLEAVLIGSLLY